MVSQALGVAERMAAYVDGLEVDGPGQLIVHSFEPLSFGL